MSDNQAIFKSIFGEQWDNLPVIMKKHYANRPFCDDVVVAEGKMDIEFGWLIKLVSPFLRVFGVLVPYRGVDIHTVVNFRSEPDSSTFCMDRVFNFPNKRPYIFYSKLVPIRNDEMIEFMKFGIGWKHRFFYNGEKVILEHKGYVLKLFGKAMPIPLGLLIGKGYAEEKAISDNSFRMRMTITHPLWGKMYEYRGVFEIND